MRKTPLHALALVALLVAACVTTETQPLPAPPPPASAPASAAPPPPPPPAQPAMITEAEAVRIAANFARSRGLSVQRYRARLDAKGRWTVDLKEQHGEDRAKVLIDARDGRLLRAKLRRDIDDDWD